jgi:photosystem II stability/assembly factor-like uncharacterized protein
MLKKLWATIFLIIVSIVTYGQQLSNFWEPTGGPAGSFVNTIAVNNSGDIFAGTNNGIFRSGDSGNIWMDISDSSMNKKVRILTINANDEIFAGTEGGLFLSTDNGSSWSSINNGLIYTSIRGLVIGANDQIFVGVVDSSTGLAGSIFLSDTNGQTWTEVDSGLIGEDVVRAFLVDTSKNVYIATNGGGVLQRDVFYHWDESNQFWNQMHWFAPTFSIRSLSVTKDNLFFAGTDIGMLRSSDNGLTWEPADLFLETILSIETTTDNNLYAGTAYNGVFYSTDKGISWYNQSSGLLNRTILSLKIGPEDRLFAGTYGDGVYRSVNPILSIDNLETYPAPQNDFTLAQNYPNPFNPSTIISFYLPQTAFVKLRIYNLSGGIIATLVSKRLSAGKYSYEWNASGFSSGLYLYSLTTETFNQVKKMILIH